MGRTTSSLENRKDHIRWRGQNSLLLPSNVTDVSPESGKHPIRERASLHNLSPLQAYSRGHPREGLVPQPQSKAQSEAQREDLGPTSLQTVRAGETQKGPERLSALATPSTGDRRAMASSQCYPRLPSESDTRWHFKGED